MYLITALGNYGEKYATTRHNAGWLVLDEVLGDVDWGYSKYADADYFHDAIGEQAVEYLKPHTMMNLSGNAVKYAVNKHELSSDQVIVIHDDLAIPMGEIKISYNRGSAEHNGVESVTQALGTKAYTRIRIGIGDRGLIPLKSYVLMKFSEEELNQLKELASQVKKAITLIVSDGVEKAMNIINERQSD
ncbi:aminoacyl-tRNA hydrolase [Candidatus Nomurabacteria bacterium]|nr:aminoacyl-tRNA hydrolase [Candidatus Nomurabacteria bacterium]